MPDPNLEEIWRVRQELIEKHGGVEGYFAYVQKLDRAHRQPGKKKTGRRRQVKRPR
jgi:hypothetical protein